MKKIILTMAAVFAVSFANAQDKKDGASGQTSKGKWLVEANTGNAMLGTTGFYYASQDGNSQYNLGLDGGYFIMDDLALKAGLGFGGVSIDGGGSASSFAYRLGAKYYVKSMIPVTLDLTGASGDAVEVAGETPMWLGIGAGYAWFIGNNVSIEPGLRYNHSLNDNYTDKAVLQFNIGFALHF